MLPSVVIAGAEKCGTTSLFSYLVSHPDVCGSSIKETNFFLKEYLGSKDQDASHYARYFDGCSREMRHFMEASPNYMRDAEVVAERMAVVVPDARILFVLRDPIDRLISFYKFNIGKLKLPADLTFDEYVFRCRQYERGEAVPDVRIDQWRLEGVRTGRYSLYLKPFVRAFGKARVGVFLYEELRDDAHGFMGRVCGNLGLDAAFYSDFAFERRNASFRAKMGWLHKVANVTNRELEPVFNRVPSLKRKLVRAYKAVNKAEDTWSDPTEDTVGWLTEYYQQSIEELQEVVDVCAGRPYWLARGRSGGSVF